MEAAEVIARIKPLEPALRERGVQSLSLFGSVARGEAGPDSDVDLMCELDESKPMGLIGFAGLGLMLEDAIRQRVDLVPRRSMHLGVRREADREQVKVF
jgi:hypothetical protein